MTSASDGTTPALVARIAAAAGVEADTVHPAGRGVTAEAWRVEASGGACCVLIEVPAGEREPQRYRDVPARVGARAAVQRALAHAGEPAARPLATDRTPGLADPGAGERRWMVSAWTPGIPVTGALPGPAASDLGRLLARLHALPVDGFGALVDDEAAIAGEEPDRSAGVLERWWPGLWPYDGRPLVSHPVMRRAPHLLGMLGAIRDQLERYEHPPSAMVLTHGDLRREHVLVDGERLGGLIDFGDAAIVPPAFDLAALAIAFGWEQTEAVLEAYAPNAVLRDVRRSEAQQTAVPLALRAIERHSDWWPDAAEVERLLAFLDETLPLAVRRDA